MPKIHSIVSVLILSVIFPCLLVGQDSEKDEAKSEKTRLESLWDDLAKEEPESTGAILEFTRNPEETVQFFKEHLLPLRLDEDSFDELLTKLGSDDEKVAQSAYDQFAYRDPRLHLGLEELMERAPDAPLRQRLVEVLSGRKFGSLEEQEIQLRRVNGGDEDDYFNFSSGGSSWWAEAKISRIGRNGWNSKPQWTRAVRAVKILEYLGTPEATSLLARMAQGHKDALPTIVAKKIAMDIKRKEKETR